MVSRNMAFSYGFVILLFSRNLLGSPPEKNGLGPEFCPAAGSYSDLSSTGSNADDGGESTTPTSSSDESTEMEGHGSGALIDGPSLLGLFSSGFSRVRKSITTAVGNAYETAKDTGGKVYSTIKNATLEFIEGVRKVLREEFPYYFVAETAVTNLIDTAMAPGTALNTTFLYIWTIALVLLCLSLSYIFLYFFSYKFVFGFLCSIVLLYQFFEPQQILYHFYLLLVYIFQWLYYLSVQHPYLFCFIVVLLCLASFVMYIISSCVKPVFDYLERRNERRRKKAVADSIVDLVHKLDHLEEKINRLDGLHEQVKDMNLKIDDILKAVLTQ